MSNIRWKNAIDGSFDDAADWSLGMVPGAANAAILRADGGAAYTVTSSNDETVRSLQTAANATLSIIGGTFTATGGTGKGVNAGTIDIAGGFPHSGALVVGGNLDNTGAVVLEASQSILRLAADTTLTGGGAVEMANGGALVSASMAITLTNVDNTISGAGLLSGNQMALINEAAGVIDATGVLTLDLPGAKMVNDGLLKATTPTGVLDICAVIDGSGGGTIAAGDGARVLLDGADIVGRTLRTSGSGVVEIGTNVPSATLDGRGSAVTLDGNLLVNQKQTLTVEGSISNAGAITLSPLLQSGGATLFLDADCTLSGGGRITLNNFTADIEGAHTLTNLDNIISGGGNIGLNQLTLINGKAGVIDADVADSLDIQTATFVNAGLIEATHAASLEIFGAVKNTGVIEAFGGHR